MGGNIANGGIHVRSIYIRIARAGHKAFDRSDQMYQERGHTSCGSFWGKGGGEFQGRGKMRCALLGDASVFRGEDRHEQEYLHKHPNFGHISALTLWKLQQAAGVCCGVFCGWSFVNKSCCIEEGAPCRISSVENVVARHLAVGHKVALVRRT